ncbi:hypothetical protein NSS98_22610 [Paenibacillus sp. FSL E2-0274]|uniref:hypothetical protein n=1 Tax=Paenibacillus TaxID=44249 RepID=UPI00096EEEE7|nr:hypothetical protein [Paenibacillus odorifer]OME30046.1 hypothetical protein BSK63_19015 [Paenibacillus odorifer]
MKDGAIETAYWLGELLETTPQEQEEIAHLLDQHGTSEFWMRLKEWDFSDELYSKLQFVSKILKNLKEPT